ncbi:MAG: C_GCAxxG_C_C family protein [Candidatus Hydrogenedentes bacterium]|nr:C_GCAxxG_C_C family protein [Candidatus Hydrogenedentota bacterium]
MMGLRGGTSGLKPGDPPLDVEQAGALAGALYDEGYDCAEAMVRVFVQLGAVRDIDVDTLYVVASGFGNGVGGTQGDCGALTGAILVINAVLGRRLPTTRQRYRLTARFAQQFLKRFGSLNCRELQRRGREGCRERTCETASLLAAFLNAYGD